MKEFNNLDDLSVYTINKISDIFKNHAILKGGMVLKILGSPRYTNDLDYIFIPYKSKKEIKDLIDNELKNLFGQNVQSEMHSTCIRYYIGILGIKLQIEVSVALSCKSVALSTGEIAKQNNQSGSIIRVMSYDVALAHKLAAWNERGLYRDLYDIHFMVSILDEKPDLETLLGRLATVRIKNKKVAMSLQIFLNKLEDTRVKINHNKLALELGDYLPEESLFGLDKKMKLSLNKIIEYLEKKV